MGGVDKWRLVVDGTAVLERQLAVLSSRFDLIFAVGGASEPWVAGPLRHVEDYVVASGPLPALLLRSMRVRTPTVSSSHATCRTCPDLSSTPWLSKSEPTRRWTFWSAPTKMGEFTRFTGSIPNMRSAPFDGESMAGTWQQPPSLTHRVRWPLRCPGNCSSRDCKRLLTRRSAFCTTSIVLPISRQTIYRDRL